MAKELSIFFMEGCPYCIKARKAVQELQSQNAAYAAVPVRWIDENKEAALAAKYDYYRVPTIYDGERKLYEATPMDDYNTIKSQVEAAFKAVLAGDDGSGA